MNLVIGLDIGGTKISGIVSDGKRVLRQAAVATPGDLKTFKQVLSELVLGLRAESDVRLVGAGMAGAVDAKSGRILHSPNIKFIKKFNLRGFLESLGFKRVFVDNDASCFTREELLLGQGKKFKNFVALTLGTGVGGGIVINGQLYRGRTGRGAEFGHIVLDGEFMEKTFQRLRDKGDFKLLGKLLGRTFASLTNIFEPEAIILGGGVALNEQQRFLKEAEKELKHFILDSKKQPRILVSRQNHGGALGAALLALKK